MHSLASETRKSHDESTGDGIRAATENETGCTAADATGYCAGFGAVAGSEVTSVPGLEYEASRGPVGGSEGAALDGRGQGEEFWGGAFENAGCAADEESSSTWDVVLAIWPGYNLV